MRREAPRRSQGSYFFFFAARFRAVFLRLAAFLAGRFFAARFVAFLAFLTLFFATRFVAFLAFLTFFFALAFGFGLALGLGFGLAAIAGLAGAGGGGGGGGGSLASGIGSIHPAPDHPTSLSIISAMVTPRMLWRRDPPQVPERVDPRPSHNLRIIHFHARCSAHRAAPMPGHTTPRVSADGVPAECGDLAVGRFLKVLIS